MADGTGRSSNRTSNNAWRAPLVSVITGTCTHANAAVSYIAEGCDVPSMGYLLLLALLVLFVHKVTTHKVRRN